MAAKGYATMEAVQSYLGLTFSGDQAAQAGALLAIAENFIDLETQGNGGWLNGPIVGEQYDLYNHGRRFFLRSTPVQSVESVTRRTRKVGDTPITLVAGTDYELLTPATGEMLMAESVMLYVQGYGSGTFYGDAAWSPEWGSVGGIALGGGVLAAVSYTPVQAVPPLISQCATEVVAFWLTNTIHPERYGLSSIDTADQKIVFSKMLQEGCFPANVDRYFNDFNRVSF